VTMVDMGCGCMYSLVDVLVKNRRGVENMNNNTSIYIVFSLYIFVSLFFTLQMESISQ